MTKKHIEISKPPSSKHQIPYFSQIFVFPPKTTLITSPKQFCKIFKIAAELKASIMTLRRIDFWLSKLACILKKAYLVHDSFLNPSP